MIYILMTCLLAGCGIFRKVHKESALHQTESVAVSKSDSTNITIDKSVTTIKEKADTNVLVPARTITQETYFNMDSLVNGMTAVKNGLIDIRLTLDPLTHKLSTTAVIKPQVIPVKIDKETTRTNDITSGGQVSRSLEAKSNEIYKASEVDKKPANSIWFVLMVLGISAILGYIIYRKVKL